MKYHVYTGKDGRVRCYNPETHRVVSYPRVLIEEKLGRQLAPLEHIHHKDGNPLNNELSNLEVILLSEHSRLHCPVKYFDKITNCQYCGTSFLWTAQQQIWFWGNRNRRHAENTLPFCSKRCVGLYGRQTQVKQEYYK